jgi:hypothetical protein
MGELNSEEDKQRLMSQRTVDEYSKEVFTDSTSFSKNKHSDPLKNIKYVRADFHDKTVNDEWRSID